MGGHVRGNCIECPFHGWQFDGETGKCTKIPYAAKVSLPGGGGGKCGCSVYVCSKESSVVC